jgi:hypothetical protein
VLATQTITTTIQNVIDAVTNPLISKKISDNVTENIPLIRFMDKTGHKEFESGGDSYQPLVLMDLPSGEAYTGSTPLKTVQTDTTRRANFGRKQIHVPVVVTGTELLRNAGEGETSLVNYIETQLDQARLGMINTLAGTGVGIQSDEADSDLGITGLQTILTSTPTAGTIGGLSRATYDKWRQKTDAVSTGFNTDGLVSFNRLFLDTMRGDESVGAIVMTMAGFANLNRILQGTITFNLPRVPDTQPVDIGVPAINYYGATVFFDAYQPANTASFLNLKYLKLLVHKERDMSIRPFIPDYNSDSECARILWAGNLVCSALSRQGLLYGLIETWA